MKFPTGRYTVIDSDPSTWSQNADSGGEDFVIVYARTNALGHRTEDGIICTRMWLMAQLGEVHGVVLLAASVFAGSVGASWYG